MQNNWRSLHQKFSEYGRNAKEWMRKCVLLLPEIEEQRIWKKKGFTNIYEYARQIAGMSRDKVNEGLRILKKTEAFPALRKVVEEKGVLAVKPVINIVSKETELFWAEKAKVMTKNTLETYVKEFNQTFIYNDRPRTATLSVKPSTTIAMELDPEIADQLSKLKGTGDWNTLMKEFLELKKVKLEAKKPATVEAKSRNIPGKIENYVREKTNSTCAFPGCNKPCEILHHTDRFAMYRLHDPDKIIPLCKAHERLAHLGLIENEHLEPRFWKIRRQADTDDPKYEIDLIVEKYRTQKVLQSTA